MFRDRWQAGQTLALRLSGFRTAKDLLVLGLPRGGVSVARAVAEGLGAELDVCLVRKVGVPWQPELALGAVAEGGIQVLDTDLISRCGLTAQQVDGLVERARAEVDRRAMLYRGSRPPAAVEGRTVIAVDDGLATGSTMLAAVRALRARQAGWIVVAIPVASRSAARMLEREADEVVALETPEPFYSVGAWYDDFAQVDDRTVMEHLLHSSTRQPE